MTEIESARNALRALGLDPDEVQETFARSSGPGGQNVNKVETSVRLVHPTSGLVAKAEDSRSREQNRRLAWQRLADAAKAQKETNRLAALAERARARRRAARRSSSTKRRLVEGKRRRGEIKKLRGHPSETPH